MECLRAVLVEITGGFGQWADRARQCASLLRTAGFQLSVLTEKRAGPVIEAGRRQLVATDFENQVNVLGLRSPVQGP